MRRVALVLLAFVGVVTSMPLPALAATASSSTGSSTSSDSSDTTPSGPLNITISPDSQELVTKPGVPVTGKFQIHNNGPQTEHLKITIKTFTAEGEQGLPRLFDAKPQDDFIHWIKLQQSTITVEPNVWETFSFTISPPNTAAFGYYYALDVTRTVQVKSANRGNTLLSAIDGLVLLDVKAPGEVRKSNLVEFSTPNRLVEFLPENFQIRMKNAGNVHVAPRGNINIYKGGKPVGLLVVNPEQGNILPGTYRSYKVRWTDGTPVYKTVTTRNKKGEPQDTSKLSWSNFKLNKLRFGKYTAELEMIYNNGQYDVPQTAKLDFWVIPWRILFVVLLIAVFVFAGIWAIFIRPIRHRLKGGQHRRGRKQA